MWWLLALRRAALQQQNTTPNVAHKVSLVFSQFEHTHGWKCNATLPRKSAPYLAQFGHTGGCEYSSNTQGVAPLYFRLCLGRQGKSSDSTSAA